MEGFTSRAGLQAPLSTFSGTRAEHEAAIRNTDAYYKSLANKSRWKNIPMMARIVGTSYSHEWPTLPVPGARAVEHMRVYDRDGRLTVPHIAGDPGPGTEETPLVMAGRHPTQGMPPVRIVKGRQTIQID